MSILPPHLAAVMRGHRASRRAHEQRDAIWQHFQPFLTSRGYQLAWAGDNLHPPDLRLAVNPFSPRSSESFAAATAGRNGVRWSGPRAYPFLMGAYDRSQRFVVVKIVSSGSEELLILRRLSTTASRQDSNNHTIPVLDILQTGEWTVIVMAAWELTLRECIPVSTAAEFLKVATQCLQGLAYMHRQRIAHLDIYPSNILVNHVTHRPKTGFLHRFDFRLAYIDFEFSVYVPPNNPLIDVRRLAPTYRDLPEVKAKHSHVDPFAADVFALGKALKDHVMIQIDFESDHQGATASSRDLRRKASRYMSLLDRMTSNNPAARPSIDQALQEARVIATTL